MLHPDIEHLKFLLGTWTGTGEGTYPTIEPFTFNEVATYSHVGKPFVAYSQRTKHALTGEPLHAEHGYFRPVGIDRVEFVVVQPSGIVEVHHGTIEGKSISLRASTVFTTPTAKDVSSVQRDIEVDGQQMNWRIAMGAVGQEHQHHLQANLSRTAR